MGEVDETKITEIDYEGMKFCLSRSPRPTTFPTFVDEWRARNVTAICRACEALVEDREMKKAFREANIVDLEMPDGTAPSSEIVQKWLECLVSVYGAPKDRKKMAKKGDKLPGDGQSVAIYCVAGLGRSALLVCIALIEYGMGDYQEVIMFMKEKRADLLNEKQLEYLKNYKKMLKGGCIVM